MDVIAIVGLGCVGLPPAAAFGKLQPTIGFDLLSAKINSCRHGMLGYHPDAILAGRRTNDGMDKYVTEQTVKQLIQAGHHIKGAKVTLPLQRYREQLVAGGCFIDVKARFGATALRDAGYRAWRL